MSELVLDLAADTTVPILKIKQKLRQIQTERDQLTARFTTTSDYVSDGARLIEACFTLLAEPRELYPACDDEQRRRLGQAIFAKLYVDDETIAGRELSEIFASLHAVYDARRATTANESDPPTNTGTHTGPLGPALTSPASQLQPIEGEHLPISRCAFSCAIRRPAALHGPGPLF